MGIAQQRTIHFFFLTCQLCMYLGLPGGSDSKESACNARDLDSIPGLGRSPEEGKDYPLQYSGMENSMGRGAWNVFNYSSAFLEMSLQELTSGIFLSLVHIFWSYLC